MKKRSTNKANRNTTHIHLLERLVGRWHLKRTYDNGSILIGTALITKKSELKFDYHEQGVITLNNGKQLQSSRKYIYKPSSSGFDIYFYENPDELFQNIVLKDKNGTLYAEATHFCVKDVYASSYKFITNQQFEINHVVRGPKKSYASKALYLKNDFETI